MFIARLLHGLTTWAVTTIIVLWTLSMLAGTAVAGAFNIAGGALSGLTQAVGAVAPAAGPPSEVVDEMLDELPGGATDQSRAAAEIFVGCTRLRIPRQARWRGKILYRAQ